MMDALYFTSFEDCSPPPSVPLTISRERLWHFIAALSLGLGLWYCQWRWTHSLNPDALAFSISVALAETLALVGCALFYFDIWRQEDTAPSLPPKTRALAGLSGKGPILLDVYITTVDESAELLEFTIRDALSATIPDGYLKNIFVLDDGNRAEIARLARRYNIEYFARGSKVGFKAGNLRHALLRTNGDFFLICDADTRIFKHFFVNTLGYFCDATVAWVQTPHWFYDIPDGREIDDASFSEPKRRLRCALKVEKTNDPFMSDPGLFFDVIQRRRNRNNASFCCGAASIHRREALLAVALHDYSKRLTKKRRNTSPALRQLALAAHDFEPFRYHVSEDIYTSIQSQSMRTIKWKSVYHPNIESKMLSPWGMQAWASQRGKYAGGSLNIFIRDNIFFKRGLPLKTKLHYGATFWSYLSSTWLFILLCAPVLALLSGQAPVSAPTHEFFMHLIPFLIANEMALIIGCYGYDINKGRKLAIACIPLTLRALYFALRGRRITFNATPKIPLLSGSMSIVKTHILLIFVTSFAIGFACFGYIKGWSNTSLTFLILNGFWGFWNIYSLWAAPRAALWCAPKASKG